VQLDTSICLFFSTWHITSPVKFKLTHKLWLSSNWPKSKMVFLKMTKRQFCKICPKPLHRRFMSWSVTPSDQSPKSSPPAAAAAVVAAAFAVAAAPPALVVATSAALAVAAPAAALVVGSPAAAALVVAPAFAVVVAAPLSSSSSSLAAELPPALVASPPFLVSVVAEALVVAPSFLAGVASPPVVAAESDAAAPEVAIALFAVVVSSEIENVFINYRRHSGILGKFNFAELTFGQFQKNNVWIWSIWRKPKFLCVNLNFISEVMCQVEKKTGDVWSLNEKNRKLQFILNLIVKEHHFMTKLFKIALRVPKNSPDLESGGAGVGCCKNAIWHVNLPVFLNLTRRFACKLQVDTFSPL